MHCLAAPPSRSVSLSLNRALPNGLRRMRQQPVPERKLGSASSHNKWVQKEAICCMANKLMSTDNRHNGRDPSVGNACVQARWMQVLRRSLFRKLKALGCAASVGS